MKVLIDPPKFDYTRFNRQIVKTETAGKLLNYYGDLIQHIELAIAKESEVKKIPKKVVDIPTFKNLLYNKAYTNVFSIKLNNIHKLAEEFHAGYVYLEKLTLSNRSKWLKKNFKDEVKMFAATYKEVIVKSFFDMTDKHNHLKYDIIFNFNGVNPDNQAKFEQINQLTRQKLTQKELMGAFQEFINVTEAPDMKIISKAQLLDLIESELRDKPLLNEEAIVLPKLSSTDILTVGKIHYPSLHMRITGTKNGPTPRPRYFIGNNKGSYAETGVKHLIVRNIINTLLKLAKDNGAINLVFSTMTDSVYFNMHGEYLRLSDHTKPFNGINVIINWNTDPKQALDAFKSVIAKIAKKSE
jgi:hypothetical protein